MNYQSLTWTELKYSDEMPDWFNSIKWMPKNYCRFFFLLLVYFVPNCTFTLKDSNIIIARTHRLVGAVFMGSKHYLSNAGISG